MKLKMEKAKHDHKLTNFLKVALFTLLMFLPFINVAVRSAYVTFNRNAYQSYYGETINEKEITQVNFNDLQVGKNYELNFVNNITDITNTNFDVTNVVVDGVAYDDVNQFRMYATNVLYLVGTVNGTQLYYWTYTNQYSFTFTGFTSTNGNAINNATIYEVNFNSYSFLDNVFEYSINQLKQNPLYNWALNTGIYTGIATMTTQLGITTTVIPMIMTYWLMLTVIYIIIDIVIQLFVYLTHIFSKD